MNAIAVLGLWIVAISATGMQVADAAWKHFDYVCADKSRLGVDLHEQDVRVTFKGRVYRMKQTIAASGTRYSDGKIVWWSKGRGGFLQTESGNTMLAQGCELVTSGLLTGTVSYRERIAMPPDAVLVVELRDVSLADAPANLLAEQKIKFQGRQVPVPFELTFDPSKINPKHAYAVSGRILVGDQPRFVSNSPRPALTRNSPTHVELVLVAAHH
jgi:putative lipoprotein